MRIGTRLKGQSGRGTRGGPSMCGGRRTSCCSTDVQSGFGDNQSKEAKQIRLGLQPRRALASAASFILPA